MSLYKIDYLVEEVGIFTNNDKVDVAGRQIETGAEGAEDFDACLWPQSENGAADAVHDGGAHQVLRLRRRHVLEEVLDLFVEPVQYTIINQIIII